MHNEAILNIDVKELFLQKLRSVIDATSCSVGKDYFYSLARELSKTFDVEYVFISEFKNNYSTLRTIVNWSCNKIIENIEYETANTPCAQALKNDITFYPKGLRNIFPLDKIAFDIEADSYLAIPYYSSNGRVLGLICLLSQKEMNKNIYDDYLLKIISGRVSAEYMRRKSEEQLMHMATHDSLTNIPNKMLFWDRINTAIARSDRNGNKFGLLFIDLDNFKIINDTYGHHKGDQLLIELTQRLKKSCRETDTICRYGGDEFVIIIEALNNTDDITSMADELHHKVVDTDYIIDSVCLHADVSIGAAIYPEHGNDSDNLVKHADYAMYQAKKSQAPYQLYDNSQLIKH